MEPEAATVASWAKGNRQDVGDIEGLLDDIPDALRTSVLFELEVAGPQRRAGAPGILTQRGSSRRS